MDERTDNRNDQHNRYRIKWIAGLGELGFRDTSLTVISDNSEEESSNECEANLKGEVIPKIWDER